MQTIVTELKKNLKIINKKIFFKILFFAYLLTEMWVQIRESH